MNAFRGGAILAAALALPASLPTPAHAAPDHTAPAHAAPDHTAPAHAAPGHAAPAHAVPGQAVPAHAVPGQAVAVRGVSGRVAGAGPGGLAWSVKPAGVGGRSRRDFFVYTLSPGQRIRDTVVITNLSDRPLTFRVYATDAFNTADGSFALLTADRQADDVGTWISIAGAPARTVQPGRSARLPFTLAVPSGATPGDHSGGVIAAVTEQTTGAQGRRVNVDRRVAARVYARVNGALSSSLQVESLKVAPESAWLGTGSVLVTYRVRNAGNVRLAATTRIGVSGPFGIGLGRAATRRVPELLPGNAYTFTDRVRGVFPAGSLTATLKLTPLDSMAAAPGATRPTVRTAGWWATPWTAVGAVVLAVALFVLYRRRTRS
ncbi:WxL protein peptidoglycan domain-containing protein [Actinomadura sp. 9N215]|uniref:WxL protein peptidoglycan domain-containing protein n=1 Tax=Actinomadura sp. 9N215 TaxID=3375150 RepID=UPI0037A77D04